MDSLKIPIASTFDGQGAAAATKAVENLELATKKAAATTQEHGEKSQHAGGLIEELGSRSGHTRHLVEGLEQATRGGTSGILGLARAAFVAGEALNPATLALGALIALAPEIVEHLGGSEKEIGEGGKEAAKGLEEMTKAGESAGKVKLDGLIDQLKEADTAAKNLAEKLDATLDAEARVDKAHEKLELLRNDRSPMLSDEQKARNEVAIRQKYADRATAREREKISGQYGLADAEASGATSAAEQAEHDRDVQRSVVTRAKRRQHEQEELSKELRAQESALIQGDGDIGRTFDLREMLGKMGSAETLARITAEAEGRLKQMEESAEKLSREAKDKRAKANQTATIAGIRYKGLNDSADLEAQGNAAEGRPKIEVGADKDSRTLGRVIGDRVSSFFYPSRAPFDDRFYHDSLLRDRDRAHYDQGSASYAARGNDFARAKSSAMELSQQLAGGKGTTDDMKQLADLLAQIGTYLGKNSGDVSALRAEIRTLRAQLTNSERSKG